MYVLRAHINKSIFLIVISGEKNAIYIDELTRNGNGSGSDRIFPYPDPTRGPRPAAQTRPANQDP